MISILTNKKLLKSDFSFSFWLGLICVFSIFSLATLSFFWTPYDVTVLEISNRFKTPSFQNILGTDHFGRDILSMVMVGAQTSIAVALVAVSIGIIFGLPLGMIAAAKRGTFFDDLVMRFNDLIFAFPALIIAILITAIFGPGAFNAIIAIGIFLLFASIIKFGQISESTKKIAFGCHKYRNFRIKKLTSTGKNLCCTLLNFFNSFQMSTTLKSSF